MRHNPVSSGTSHGCVSCAPGAEYTGNACCLGYVNGDSMKKFFILVKKKGVETAILPLQVLKVRDH